MPFWNKKLHLSRKVKIIIAVVALSILPGLFLWGLFSTPPISAWRTSIDKVRDPDLKELMTGLGAKDILVRIRKLNNQRPTTEVFICFQLGNEIKYTDIFVTDLSEAGQKILQDSFSIDNTFTVNPHEKFIQFAFMDAPDMKYQNLMYRQGNTCYIRLLRNAEKWIPYEELYSQLFISDSL